MLHASAEKAPGISVQRNAASAHSLYDLAPAPHTALGTMFRLPSAPALRAAQLLSRSRPRPRHAQLRCSSEWAAAKAQVDADADAWRARHGDRCTLLVVYHSRTGGAAAMAAEAVRGALEGLERAEEVPDLQAAWDTAEFRAPSSSPGSPGSPGDRNPNPDSGKSAASRPDISAEAGSGSISGPGAADRASSSPSVSESAEASETPAPNAEDDGHVDIRVLPAPLAGPADLLTASGYLFVCPENLAAMSGPMKDFFDRCFYPALHRLNGRPYQALICAGSDGAGAAKQLERIATGWRLKKVEDTVVCNVKAQSEERVYAAKEIGEEDKERCREAGMRIAVGLSVGMF